MELQGTVRNVIDFGAFVDIGIKNDGLVHISQLSNGFVKHPMDVVSVGDNVTVWVLNIDLKKGRVGLTMRQPKESNT
ncbi:30S ribosomal protein S1 [compost metagenome]